MAKENISRFIEAAITDKALAAKVAALATENGYGFTADEFLELGETRPLSDNDAGDARGGGAIPPGVAWPGLLKRPAGL